MINGTTKNGFAFEVNESVGKDFRIIMATKKLNSENTIEKIEGTYDFVEAVLGKSGVEKLIKFVVDKAGYADTEMVLSEAKEVLAFASENNNEIKK